jgi:ATP-dependent RNA helicase DeaD
MNHFKTLGVNAEILKAIEDLGFETPTPIQTQAIPMLITGDRDFIGLAHTGTGKTAAFGLPLLELTDFESPKTQALIICPTRELCVQIAKDLNSYAKYIDNVNIVAVYGGTSIVNQIKDIKRGAQIIVATPGRLMDLMERKAVNIKNIQFVVLDEADEMLNMGFREDIENILSDTPEDKLTWLFSATMPAEVRAISKNFMFEPLEVTIGNKGEGNVNIEHQYYAVKEKDKYSALKRIMDMNENIFGIVFSRTKIETQEIAEKLMKDGYNADALHGDLSQQQRDKVMARFRNRSLQMLIATDVAARGIDVNNVTHIIHYSLPDEIENYTHRSGRTARAGKTGISIALIAPRDLGKIRQIERLAKIKFRQEKLPTGVEVCKNKLFSIIHKIHNVEVNNAEIEPYLPQIFDELKELSKEELIKRFASLEFNRFLEYYKGSNDINADAAGSKGSFDDRSYTRLFISLGEVDGFDNSVMFRYLIENSSVNKSAFGKIALKKVYSFFEVETAEVDAFVKSFKLTPFKGREVRIEFAGDREEGSRDRGHKRSGGGGGKYDRKDSYRGGGHSGGGGGRFNDHKKKKRSYA